MDNAKEYTMIFTVEFTSIFIGDLEEPVEQLRADFINAVDDDGPVRNLIDKMEVKNWQLFEQERSEQHGQISSEKPSGSLEG